MSDTTPVLRFISLEETIEILNEHHCTGLGRKVLEAGIKQGVFDFGKCVEMGNNRYIISKAKLMRFIEENIYDEPIDPSILEFMKMHENENTNKNDSKS